MSRRFAVAAAPPLELVDARPVLPLRTLPAGYFIYSADWQPPSSISAGSTAILALGGLNDFLGTLVSRVLMLEAGPPTTSTSTSTGTSNFLIQDEWASWMVQSVGAQSLSVVWNSDSSGDVEGFAVQFLVPLNLRYVTTATILGSPGAVTPTLGLLNQGIMVFGLVPPDPVSSCSLANVLDFTGFPTSSLYGLASSIGLVLDTSPQNRNAVWFWPNIHYETTVRLQFTLDPGDALTVSNFVKDTLATNLAITDVKVIARRIARTWDLDTEQRIRPDSELIFSMMVVHPDARFQGYIVFDEDYVSVIIRPSLTFEAILTWIVGLVGDSGVDVGAVMGWVPVSSSDIQVVQITMQASHEGIIGFSVDVQIDITFGGGQKVPFLVSL